MASEPRQIHNVAGVMVLYEPGPEGPEAVRRAAGLVERLFVVDNSAPPVTLDSAPPHVRHIRNCANLGVAKALNQGLLAAREAGFAYTLLLDQDSWIEKPSLERLLAAQERLADAFIVCPRVLHEPDALPRRSAEGDVNRVAVAISSGSLVDLARLDEVGLHDEELFIDYVDFEYCLRAGLKGYSIYRVEDAVLSHRLGDRREARLLGLRRYPTHHSPERRYYKTRNMLYVRRRYVRTHPQWVRQSVRKLFNEMLEIWLFEQQKWKKTCACLEGVRDFFLDRYGPRWDNNEQPDYAPQHGGRWAQPNANSEDGDSERDDHTAQEIR